MCRQICLHGLAGAGCDGTDIPRQSSSRQGTPRRHRHFLVLQQRDHFAFFFPVEQIVQVLHGNKFRPAVLLGGELGFGKLPSMHGGSSDVTHFPHFHQIVQCFHRFFDRCVVIPAVDDVQIQIIRLQSFQRVIDFRKDAFAGQAFCVRSLEHREI